MTDVPWTTLEPGTTEKVISVMLCRRHPAARRIRPSRGDGGLDVVVPVGPGGQVDVDQIKYFSKNLGAGQKRQIHHSLEAAIATHEDPDSSYRIRQWHVTMPLDATRELETWLRETAEQLGAPFPVAIRGLLFVEGLVTAYPEVVDYYVHNGAARVNELVADLSNLAGLARRDDAGNRIEPDQAEAPLRRLHQSLNRDDPHFRYEFQVSDQPPPMIDRPMLVCSATNCGPDGCVTWHVFAKHADFHHDRPVPLNLTFRPERTTEQQRADWASAMTYGTDVELAGPGVVTADLDLPAGLGHSGELSLLRLGPARQEPGQGTRARWVLKDPDGTELAALVLHFGDATTGPKGGERRLGHDPDRLLEVELRSHFAADGEPLAPLRIAVRLASPYVLRGVPAQRALPVARFIGAWKAGHRLTVAPEYGAGEVEAAVISSDLAAPAWLTPLVEALAVIGDHTGTALPLPALGDVHPECLDGLLLVADVLRGGRAEVRFASAVALVPDDHVDQYLSSSEPRLLAWPLPAVIAGVPVQLPPAVLTVEDAQARTTTEEAGEDGLTAVALTASAATRAWIVLQTEDGS